MEKQEKLKQTLHLNNRLKQQKQQHEAKVKTERLNRQILKEKDRAERYCYNGDCRFFGLGEGGEGK